MENQILSHAREHLHKLCVEIDTRLPGSLGNHQATDYFASIVEQYGFLVRQQSFDCIDWQSGALELSVGGHDFDAHIGPYSLGCDVRAPLAAAGTLAELESIDAQGKILLLYGEIARSQLMPKNFVFYNPDEHKYVYRLLEEKLPAAVLSATDRDPDLAGGIYPFPLIEDGDFDIPNAYMKEEVGRELLHYTGQPVALKMEASRHPASGVNVIATKGDPSRKILVVAHIDAKMGTPGALDNGTGVVMLLLLAELLAEYDHELGIEIVALNGEDYYNAPGQMEYMESYNWNFDDVILAINTDLAGYKDGPSEYATYQCPEEVQHAIEETFEHSLGIIPGEPWYQSDHAMFVQQGRPALSFTSSQWKMITREITHTSKDHPGLVDVARIVELAQATTDLIYSLVGPGAVRSMS